MVPSILMQLKFFLALNLIASEDTSKHFGSCCTSEEQKKVGLLMEATHTMPIYVIKDLVKIAVLMALFFLVKIGVVMAMFLQLSNVS